MLTQFIQRLLIVVICVNIICVNCVYSFNAFSITPNVPIQDDDIASECDLKCFIHKINIHLPNITQQVLFWDLYLTDIVCFDIDINKIASALGPNSTLKTNFTELGIKCSLDYSWGIFSGNASTVVANNSFAYLNIELVKDLHSGLVDHAKLLESNVFINVTRLDFSSIFFNSKLIKSITRSLLDSQLPKVIEQEFTVLVNQNLTSLFRYVNSVIAPYLHPPPNISLPNFNGTVPVVNLTNNPVIQTADYALNDVIGLSINNIIDHWSNWTGILDKNDLMLNYTLSLSFANITFGLNNVTLSQLNTWDTVQLLIPKRSYILDNRLKLFNLGMNASFFVDTEFQGYTLHESGMLWLSARQLSLLLDLVLELDSRFLNSLNFDQITCVGCLRDSVLFANVSKSRIDFLVNHIKILATNQNSVLEKQVDLLLDNTLSLFVDTYFQVIPAFANAFAVEPAIEMLNQQLLKFVKPAPCLLDIPEPDKWQLDKLVGILSFSITFGIWVFVSILVVIIEQRHRRCRRYRHKKRDLSIDDKPLLSSSIDDPIDDATYALDALHVNENEFLDKFDHVNDSLLFHNSLYGIVRYGVLLLLLLNIALFISSNASIGASVYIRIFLGMEKQLTTPSLFDFTLVTSIKDMWNAKVYALSLLITIFSGAWPYIKLILMIICWILPTKILSFGVREKILRFLDAMGKWSLIDGFILVFMMIIFNIVVNIPPQNDVAITVKTFVRPQMGFHAFILATICSFIMSHLILLFHRKTSSIVSETSDIDNEAVPLVSKHWVIGNQRVKFTRIGIIVLLGLWLTSIILFIVGTVLPSFVFQIRGAAAVAFGYLGIPIYRPYSLFSLAAQFPFASVSPNSFAIRWIQVIFILFSFVVPLLYTVTLLFLWLCPLYTKIQKHLFVIAEVLRAWSSIEVFVLSILTSLVALEKFVGFIVGDKCLWINHILQTYFGWIFKQTNAFTCFGIKTTLLSGFWVLFVSVALYIFIGYILLSICHQTLYHNITSKKTRCTRCTNWIVKLCVCCKLLVYDNDNYSKIIN